MLLLKSYQRFIADSPRWRPCWWRHLPMSDIMLSSRGKDTNWNRNLTRLWQHLCCSFKPRPEVSVWARRTWCLSSFRVYNPRFGTTLRCLTLPLYVSCSSARQPRMISNPAPSTPVYFRLLWTRWLHYRPRLSSRLRLVSPQLQPPRQLSSSRLSHRRCGSNQCRTPSHHDIGRPRINIISHHPVNGDPSIPPVSSSNETAPVVGVVGHAREDSIALHLVSVAINVVRCPTSAVFVVPHPHNRTSQEACQCSESCFRCWQAESWDQPTEGKHDWSKCYYSEA